MRSKLIAFFCKDERIFAGAESPGISADIQVKSHLLARIDRELNCREIVAHGVGIEPVAVAFADYHVEIVNAGTFGVGVVSAGIEIETQGCGIANRVRIGVDNLVAEILCVVDPLIKSVGLMIIDAPSLGWEARYGHNGH